MKVFIPMTESSEALLTQLGAGLIDLVPFDLEYEILRPEAPFPDVEQRLEPAPEPA